jgi:hypothetical protein
MSTALAIWTPSALLRRPIALWEPPPMTAYDPISIRLHLAFLASFKRTIIQQGADPPQAEASMHSHHVTWWHKMCASFVGHVVPMHEAGEDVLLAVVVPVAHGVDLASPLFRWYPDGWHEMVAWAAAGARRGNTAQASGLRVYSSGATDAQRFAHMSREDALDAGVVEPERPALRVVQANDPDPGPLFASERAPYSDDLEAEIEADWEDIT